MPLQKSRSQWPTPGERRLTATLQSPTQTIDSLGGRAEAWVTYDTWKVAVTQVPFIVSETQSTMQFMVEGLYRSDLKIGHRVLVRSLTLKVTALENPDTRNRTLVAHCLQATRTQ